MNATRISGDHPQPTMLRQIQAHAWQCIERTAWSLPRRCAVVIPLELQRHLTNCTFNSP